MKVCEIFESLQGEGRLMGQPCLFIRVYGCDLRCSTCDTKYSYSNGQYEEYSILKLVELLLKTKQRNVVFTGGEPLLYKNELLEIGEMFWLKKNLMLETNGTILDDMIPLYFKVITVSPKKQYKNVKQAIGWWSTYRNVDFKFVVGSSEWTWTLDEIGEILKEFNLSPEKVWLMPEGTTPQELDKLSKQIWEFCVTHGCNYSDRLHVRVWNGIRGK